MKSLDNLRTKLNAARLEHETNKTILKRELKNYIKEVDLAFEWSEALSHIQTITETLQREAHTNITELVTQCLQTVFDKSYEFQISFEKRRNVTEAILTLIKDGEVYRDPLFDAGGGVADVISFGLRLACLMYAKPKKARLLILDEPFKFVSAKHRNNIRLLLDTLSTKLGVQFVMITHIPELQLGKVLCLPITELSEQH